MFTKLTTRTRGVVAIAGIAGSIGLGSLLAPVASALPPAHQCDRLVKAIGAYTRVAEMYGRRGDLDAYLYYYQEAGLAQKDAQAAGCSV